MVDDRMMKWFEFDHLGDDQTALSAGFYELAVYISVTIYPGPERTVALRKLLEAKDAAVRATIHKGG